MVCITLFGLELAVDFTAPALLALLALLLPEHALFCTLAACLIHEAAHFLAMAALRQRPAQLRVSAVGLRMQMRQDILCPLPAFCAILLAGAAANFLAAQLFFAVKLTDAAYANLSLALFNLLPYRSTDGGTLLYALLEHALIGRRPALLKPLMCVVCTVTTAALTVLLCAARITNPSVWGMVVFMTLCELLDG